MRLKVKSVEELKTELQHNPPSHIYPYILCKPFRKGLRDRYLKGWIYSKHYVDSATKYGFHT